MTDVLPEDPRRPGVVSAANTGADTPADIPADTPATIPAAALAWTGALTSAALVLVPLWMLMGNSAVLSGHPALPALLLAALVPGLLWMFLLIKHSLVKDPVVERSPRPASGPAPGAEPARVDKGGGPEGRRPPRRASRRKLLRGMAGRLIVLVLLAALAWLSPFPHQPGGAGSQTTGAAVGDATSLTLIPDGVPTAGLVFYPGARVDAHAYQDVLGPLVDAGHLVVILKPPLGLSLLDTGQARGSMERHPGVTSWAVGGHSLGGVSASSFARTNGGVSGLLLYGSYPAESLADVAGLSVLSIAGSNDGLTTPDKIAASTSLLPPATRFATVQGGIHAFFGDYGEQPGDGTPGTGRSEAQQQIAAESVRFMDRLRSAR